LTVRKIVEIAAIRYHILNLKCTKFDFGWGSAPYPTWGAYTGFKGPTSTGRKAGNEGQGRGNGKGE